MGWDNIETPQDDGADWGVAAPPPQQYDDWGAPPPEQYDDWGSEAQA